MYEGQDLFQSVGCLMQVYYTKGKYIGRTTGPQSFNTRETYQKRFA